MYTDRNPTGVTGARGGGGRLGGRPRPRRGAGGSSAVAALASAIWAFVRRGLFAGRASPVRCATAPLRVRPAVLTATSPKGCLIAGSGYDILARGLQRVLRTYTVAFTGVVPHAQVIASEIGRWLVLVTRSTPLSRRGIHFAEPLTFDFFA